MNYFIFIEYKRFGQKAFVYSFWEKSMYDFCLRLTRAITPPGMKIITAERRVEV